MRLMEEEAHKQTGKKTADASGILEKLTEEKQYHFLFEINYHVVEQMLSKSQQETFVQNGINSSLLSSVQIV